MKLFEVIQQLTPEQVKWLGQHVDGKWEYENGLVNVEGTVNVAHIKLTNIPVQFGYVSGHFHCQYNNLTSLSGAPREVGGNFYCQYNNLTTLSGAPREVGGSFHCYGNNLTSLSGAPREVGGNFYCTHNKFKSEPDTSLIKIGGIFQWK